MCNVDIRDIGSKPTKTNEQRKKAVEDSGRVRDILNSLGKRKWRVERNAELKERAELRRSREAGTEVSPLTSRCAKYSALWGASNVFGSNRSRAAASAVRHCPYWREIRSEARS